MAASPQDDPFLEEVIGLFVQEAQEWLAQINDALLELERGQAPERATKQFEIMLRGLTNLGGSAATVEVKTVERVALSLVPLLQALQSRGGRTAGDRFAIVREGLQAVASAIQDATGAEARAGSGFDHLLQRIVDATVAQGATAPVPGQPSCPRPEEQDPAVPSRSFSVMDVLLNLRRGPASSSEHSRHVLETVLQRVRADSDRGTGAVDLLPSVLHVLRELKRLDELFLVELEQRLPEITRGFHGLKAEWAAGRVPSDRVAKMLGETRCLHEVASNAGAREAALFFAGLQVFLQVAARRHVVIPPQRFDAVESRLRDIIPLAKQWVDLGLVERTAIETALSEGAPCH